MTQRMTTRKILVDALGVLGPNGENWIKHDFAHDGRYCMVGAVNKVAVGNAAQMTPVFSPDKQDNEILRDRALLFLRLATGTTDGSLADWNDSSDRKFSEVERAFLDAIGMARGDEL